MNKVINVTENKKCIQTGWDFSILHVYPVASLRSLTCLSDSKMMNNVHAKKTLLGSRSAILASYACIKVKFT